MDTVDALETQEMTRGQKLWATLRDRRDKEPVSLERARLLTASYKETEGMPVPIRRAKAFEKILTEIPIYIDEGQLLVGDAAARPMAAEWYPEHAVELMSKEIEDGGSPYTITKEEIPLFREICDYWKDRAVKESFLRFQGDDDLKKINERSQDGAWIFSFSESYSKGWSVPNYPKAINKGLLGIIDEVEEELRAIPIMNDESREKVYFLQAIRIVLKADIQYAGRYSNLAAEMAKDAKGGRKKELERIAEICSWVPAHPARSFREALQTMWFCHLFIHWDIKAHGVSPGRVDQYLYPYYKQDTENGNLTMERAIELLECFRIKLSSIREFQDNIFRENTAGEADWHNCTLGGQTTDGKDATNELSYLWLEAAMRTKTPHPTLSVRVHENLSPDFAMKAAELCSLGLGYPAWFGDKTIIPYLLQKGCSLEDARDYALAGCVLHVPQHKSAPSWPLTVSMPKVFELALNDGCDPRTGKQIGLQTGKFEDLSYDELYEAFKEQSEYFITDAVKLFNECRAWRSAMEPQIADSCFFDDCIKRGQNSLGGGCQYQYSMYLLPIGIMDVVDSLAAIKQRVFEEGSLSKKELMEALNANFEGKESVQRLLFSSHKYGNDDDYADSIAVDLYRWLCEVMESIDACYGVKWVCAPHSVSLHGAAGRRVGALPSGRLAGTSLADGAVSPCQGVDSEGPTAVINSAGKIDQLPIYGVLLNMKFHPSALKTRDDLGKFLSLIKTYLVEYGGKHIQFNVVSKETLLDAQEHPENYRNLIVRVAGYSALWIELDRVIQDEVISRTEHSL